MIYLCRPDKAEFHELSRLLHCCNGILETTSAGCAGKPAFLFGIAMNSLHLLPFFVE
jgi:hypothetical protein